MKVASAVTPSTPQNATVTKAISPERVFDPIEAKESWSKLLGKRVVPKCEHDEPCISLVTKKPGVNCGRSFYICPRPLGPSGDKERDTEWRCATFIWSSDWGAAASSGSIRDGGRRFKTCVPAKSVRSDAETEGVRISSATNETRE
ncbi:hypothetical protein NQ176_g3840 [Zarea fungicola]|uniref:Uncharacterized protein n=1 Tax=Zarea fungicola TaxID=93591 RepID=A0ACC1NIN2_9HYPO|nr:hypothetical protein NQ176_g3840 [Lecanicillium fungicola]